MDEKSLPVQVQALLAANRKRAALYKSVGADPEGAIVTVRIEPTLEASFTAYAYLTRVTGLPKAPKDAVGMNLWQLMGKKPIPRNVSGLAGQALGTIILNGVQFDPNTAEYTAEDIEAGKYLAEDWRANNAVGESEASG